MLEEPNRTELNDAKLRMTCRLVPVKLKLVFCNKVA